jgi:hypothetical protein
MQQVSLAEDGPVVWAGVPDGGLARSGSDGSVRPWRLPIADLELFVPTQGTEHHELSSNSILQQASNASGVRLTLSTDTTALRMTVRPRLVTAKNTFDLVADGKVIATHGYPDVEPQRSPTATEPAALAAEMLALAQETPKPIVVEFTGIVASGMRTLELWLPHRAAVTVLGLEVAAGASVAPPIKDVRPRLIAYGSSITHGIGGADNGCAHGPARTWPGTAARLANVNLLNLGVGGQCHFDQVCEPRPARAFIYRSD